MSPFPRQLASITREIGRMQHTCYNAFHPKLELRIPFSFDTRVSIEPACSWTVIHT